MAEKVRQHTVPKVYLKNFGTIRKKNTYVYVFDKKSGRTYQSEISNVSVERNFYRLEKPSDPLFVENFYSRYVEPQTGEVIEEIIERASINIWAPDAKILTSSIQVRLSVYMLYQVQRGRVAKDFMLSKKESILPNAKRRAQEFALIHQIQDADNRITRLLSDENIWKAAMIHASIDPSRIKNLAYFFINRCWVLYKLVGDGEFITSDNPVMFVDNMTKDAAPFQHGLCSDTTVVYYPLTDKLMLALYSYGYVDGALNKLDNKIVRLDAVKDFNFIRLVNSLQIDQCQKQAFAKTIAPFALIKKKDTQSATQ